MCGICGFVDRTPTRAPEEPILRGMCEALRHRGPDSDGMALGPGFALGFRRLAIIGLANGEQPIWNEDRSRALICNGEIYNHIELRRHLEQAGHVFATDSDAEVILHLLEDRGAGGLELLRGMFAFAAFDLRRHELFLARDRFGIKPVCFTQLGDRLLFASEVKALLRHPGVEPRLNPSAVRWFAEIGMVPSPATMFEGIEYVPPGHYLTFAGGRSRLTCWWKPDFPAADAYDRKTRAGEWVTAWREKLRETVAIHQRSDVPVGAWLSGGVDSNAVVALMTAGSRQPVRTYSLRFRSPGFDEFPRPPVFAGEASPATTWEQVWSGPETIAKLPLAVWHRESPTWEPVAEVQLLLAGRASRDVKAVLCGEGADETLGGYSWYRADKFARMMSALPAAVRRGIGASSFFRNRWPGGAEVFATWPQTVPRRYMQWMGKRPAGIFASNGTASVFSADLQRIMRATPHAPLPVPIPDSFADWHPHVQLQYLDLTIRLPGAILRGLDRTSMAHSLEARVPFMDHELAELAARIPPELKLRGFREKYVLRKAMEPLLDRSVCWRRKHALTGPVNEWLRAPLPEPLAGLITEAGLARTGIFDAAVVRRVIREHQAGINHGQLLMMILSFQCWWEQFMLRRAGPLTDALPDT